MPIELRVEVDYERLRFAYRMNGGVWQWLPQQFDASILSDEASAPGLPNFTGAFVGMACQDLAGTAMPADFDWFEYREREYVSDVSPPGEPHETPRSRDSRRWCSSRQRLPWMGIPRMHDPSTVVLHDGKFYSYGTGNGLPVSVSDDGWTWRRAGTLMQALPAGRPGPEVVARGGNNTWAPDVIRSGDKYFVYYSAPGTQPKSAIGLLVGRTLDPNSPDYKWEDGGPVVWSDGVEDSNAIDPGVFRDPTNGSLWLTYGSYFGYIRLVQLDPKTGKRLHRTPDRSTSRSTPKRRS